MLYPVAFSVLSVVLVFVGRAFPGIDDQHRYESTFVGAAFSSAMGMFLYWSYGIPGALATLWLVSHVPGTRPREFLKVMTPLVIVGGWVLFLFANGYDFIYFTSDGGRGIAISGWIATAAALLAVGALTRMDRR